MKRGRELPVRHAAEVISRKVVLVCGEIVDRACITAPRVISAAQGAQARLLRAYSYCGARTVEARYACESNVLTFHSADYLRALKPGAPADLLEDSNLDGDDCPVFDGVFEYVLAVAGASLQAANELKEQEADVAINWAGDAKPESASGFCYVNDVVLAILSLQERFDRVLCLDIDIHHGDGTQEAFYYSRDILTVSFHKYGPGIFPGTGKATDIGAGRGRNHCVNVPVAGGSVGDAAFLSSFSQVANAAHDAFHPDAVVLVCGADTLAGDPLGGWALSTRCIGSCVDLVAKWGLPLLVTGGGGYVPSSVARLNTYCTSVLTGTPIPEDIPDHDGIEIFAPDFTLHAGAGIAEAEAEEDLKRSTEAALTTLVKLKEMAPPLQST